MQRPTPSLLQSVLGQQLLASSMNRNQTFTPQQVHQQMARAALGPQLAEAVQLQQQQMLGQPSNFV